MTNSSRERKWLDQVCSRAAFMVEGGVDVLPTNRVSVQRFVTLTTQTNSKKSEHGFLKRQEDGREEKVRLCCRKLSDPLLCRPQIAPRFSNRR